MLLNRRVKKYVWIILAFTLISMNFHFIGSASASSSQISIPMVNGGFEEEVSGGEIPGWMSMFETEEGSLYYEVSDEKSQSGTKSLKIVDTYQNRSVALMSNSIPVTSGFTYTARAQIFIESGATASLNFRYYDAAGKAVAENQEVPLHVDPNKGYSRGQWHDVSSSTVAPEGAVYARVIVYTTSYSTATAYFDDIRFSYEEPVKVAGVFHMSMPSSAQLGEQFQVAVSLSEAVDVQSVNAAVYFDSARLQIIEVNPSGAFADESATFEANVDSDYIRLSGGLQEANSIQGESGVAEITFKVVGDNGSAWVILSRGSKLNGKEALFSDITQIVTIGSGSGTPVDLEEITFGQPEYLLAPIADAVGVFDGEAGIEDGKNVMYTTVKGIPPMLHVVDLDDYQLIRSVPLEGGSDVWNHAIAPDGTVYMTSGGQLWAYSPVTKTAEKVFTYAGENTFWCLAIDEQGNIYIGTGPGGKVVKFDPVTKESRDYGTMVDGAGQQYVRAIDYSNGYVYAATSHAKVYKVNVETGEKTEIAGPLNESGYVYDLNIVDDRYVIIRMEISQKRYFYDIEKGEWLDVVVENSSSGLQIPKESLDGKIYFPADKKIKMFDVETHVVEDSGMEYETAFRGANWVEVDDPDLPGKSIVTMNFAGIIVFFNPETQTVKRYENILPPNASITHRFASGPDGKIYVTGMQASKAAAYDIGTNTASTFPMGQAGAVVPFGDKLYFGVYPGGEIEEYDTNTPSVPPKKLFKLENGQDRIGEGIVAGSKIYFGSISTYGELGGAITSFDPSNPDIESSYQVFRNVVQDQSVISLAYKDGKLYGGTSINGGMAVDPKAQEAKLFVWDTVREEKITEISLDIPGLKNPPAIGGLSFGPDGLLWGAANGYVFALDPNTMKVIKYRNLNPQDSGTGFRWGSFKLEWHETGILLANLGIKMYAVHPETLEYIELPGTEAFTIGPDGHLYYAPKENRTLMHRVTINTEEPETGIPARLDLNAPVSAAKDETFSVELKAADVQDLYSIDSRLTYDHEKLQLIEINAAGAFLGEQAAITTKHEANEGTLRMIQTLLGEQSVRTDTDYAVLTFKALSDTGTAQITLRQSSSVAAFDADVTGKVYTMDQDVTRTVTLVRAVPEDVNGDGRVDLVDVVSVAKQIGAVVTEENMILDVNGDGTIDIQDVSIVVVKMLEHK
ncbi:cohesin domain-containing protein [Marinicrinis lubricantis]|uniref:Cohesin domain-containing protein n=1 Tax=Marinicrinis lubricantis TaxID=2086470 RepID=A0ABW1ILE6_9BACL